MWSLFRRKPVRLLLHPADLEAALMQLRQNDLAPWGLAGMPLPWARQVLLSRIKDKLAENVRGRPRSGQMFYLGGGSIWISLQPAWREVLECHFGWNRSVLQVWIIIRPNGESLKTMIRLDAPPSTAAPSPSQIVNLNTSGVCHDQQEYYGYPHPATDRL